MAKSCLRGKVITANFIWTGNTFENGIQMRIDQNGFISEIGKNLFKGSEELFDFGQKVICLLYRVIIKGFGNLLIGILIKIQRISLKYCVAHVWLGCFH